MSARVLRNSLLPSFVAAISLVSGVVLYQTFGQKSAQIAPPADSKNPDLRMRPAPVLSLPDIDGQPFVLSQWLGQTVLINFWASWCPPCLKEVPVLIDAQEKYFDRGLRIVGVAIDEISALRHFSGRVSFNYPVLPSTFRLMGQFGNPQGTLPYSVLVDERGYIVDQHFRPLTRDELDRILSTTLPPWPGAAPAPESDNPRPDPHPPE